METLKRLAAGATGFIWTVMLALALPGEVAAQGMVSPGFESGMEGWAEIDPDGRSVSVSDEANSGEKSAKISNADGVLQQAVSVTPNNAYILTVSVRGAGLVGVKVGEKIYFDRHPKSRNWETVSVNFDSGDSSEIIVFAGFNGEQGRFDDFRIDAAEGAAPTSASVVLKSRGGSGLSPDLKPSQNFDLAGWTLSTPADEDGNGISDTFRERDLVAGYEHDRYFYTGADGGLVMLATVGGAKTSANTRNVRSELREMLRRGDTSINTRNSDGTPNKNNWVFSSAPERAQEVAGAVDGKLRATLAVNHVTSTGQDRHIGVVVIGQIHAKSDEPLKLFYRKMPGHARGAVFASHEPVEADDVFYNLLGNYTDRDTDPEDGIALDEPFSYEIHAVGNMITVTISQQGEELASVEIDQTGSGYDVADEFMYFKAGVYNQNSSGDPEDFAQATFYEIDASH